MLALLLLGVPASWSEPTKQEVDAALAQTSASLADRLEAVTRPFIGAPYVLSPLGEGSGTDPDPRIRLDAFDCTTFVETAIALTAARNTSELPDILDGIRYRGKQISFATRRHLIDSEWIPDLVAAGVLEDVTAKIAGEATVTSRFTFSAERWRARSVARELVLPHEALPQGTFTMEWVPLDKIMELKIPPGVIMNVVREDVPWAPTRISHQALVLRDPASGRTVVRQASPVLKKVMDEPMERFVYRYQHPKVEKKWRPVGVSFFRVKG